jgi:hypothetical protein
MAIQRDAYAPVGAPVDIEGKRAVVIGHGWIADQDGMHPTITLALSTGKTLVAPAEYFKASKLITPSGVMPTGDVKPVGE